jgi:hypothetical protein
MAMPLAERTVLPPEDLGRLSGVLAALTTRRAHRAALIGPDGKRLDVPPEIFEILREVVEARDCMNHGRHTASRSNVSGFPYAGFTFSATRLAGCLV